MISVGVVFVNMIIGVSSAQKGDGGVSHFFYSGNFHNLLSAEPWTDAISHVLFSLSLGDGRLTYVFQSFRVSLFSHQLEKYLPTYMAPNSQTCE
uniref:Uncharacterized protein n=1 Tax=Ditylenchus dipsaci TaxID=166011 RepID=A0A915DJ74_9BILA